MWYELIFSISLHFISFPLHATVKPPRYAFCHCQSTLSTVSSKIIGQMRIYIIYMYIYNICDILYIYIIYIHFIYMICSKCCHKQVLSFLLICFIIS